MLEQEFNITDLNFDRLSDNDAGVAFRALNVDQVGAYVIPLTEEWKAKTCGIPQKALIRDWYLIELAQNGKSHSFLMGYSQNIGEAWCTSAVAAVIRAVAPAKNRAGGLVCSD